MIRLHSDTVIPLKHGDLNVSLNMKTGHSYGLIGKNGIGKTSFLHFLKVNRDTQVGKDKTSFLDQGALTPLGDLNCLDLFALFQETFPDRIVHHDLKEYSLIKDFGFQKHLGKPIKNLSGGENQILKILACFYLKADFYILDEASNHLDLKRQGILRKTVLKKKNEGKTILIIDHKKDFLTHSCDHFLLMERIEDKLYAFRELENNELENVFNEILEGDDGF